MKRNFTTNFHNTLCLPFSWGGTMSSALSWSQVDALSASYQNSPNSNGSTNCHDRHQFLLLWQYDCGLRLQVYPFQGWLLQSDPTRSSSFWRTCRGWIDRECCHISSYDTFFEVDLPCGILCNLLSSRTCDPVASPSSCKSSGWRRDPARTRCTSYFQLYHLPTTRALDDANVPIRQACSTLWFRLHVDYLAWFSVPSSCNRIFWFFAEKIECSMLLKFTLKCLSLRVILDLLNQVVNVDAM